MTFVIGVSLSFTNLRLRLSVVKVLSGATVHSSGLPHLFTTAQEVSEVEMLKSIQQSMYM